MPSSSYQLAKRFLFRLDAEQAHHFTLAGLRQAEHFGLMRGKPCRIPEEGLRVMGLTFPNVVGLAAGMDKGGDTVDGFGALGFGHVEVGTVTPRPQPGNEKPRLFRLPGHEALINRMGFNNPGIEGVRANLAKRRHYTGILGVNLGKNFDTPNEEAASDYRAGLAGFYDLADYFTVNLSSPNTTGLRDLQALSTCEDLIRELHEEREQLAASSGKKIPIAIKVAPDLDDDHAKGLAELFSRVGVDGVIATNTTIDRALVQDSPLAGEGGGLSGGPLRERALTCLQLWRRELDADVPVISVGGIMSGGDARSRVEAGAALVQVYTGLVYRGPGLIREILEATRDLVSARVGDHVPA